MELRYLLLKDLKNSKFQLIDEYIYKIRNHIIIVPEGFITDFASIPKIFRIFILPYGKHSSASVVHDWLYSKECEIKISRREADKIFLEIMQECGVCSFQSKLMYITVRIFGKSHFKKY